MRQQGRPAIWPDALAPHGGYRRESKGTIGSYFICWMDTATLCSMGFHSTLLNTAATQMGM